MTQEYYFGTAKWVGASERKAEGFSVLRGRFTAKKGENVTLNILGLGFFKCYINGVCINPDTFLPLSSDYEAGADPVEEVISGHRVYVPKFDITPFVRDGENVIINKKKQKVAPGEMETVTLTPAMIEGVKSGKLAFSIEADS